MSDTGPRPVTINHESRIGLPRQLADAAYAAYDAAEALARLATCGADLAPCRCPAVRADEEPPELGQAVWAFERLGLRAGWKRPKNGCYWAQAARLWRKRAKRLEAAAEALAAL